MGWRILTERSGVGIRGRRRRRAAGISVGLGGTRHGKRVCNLWVLLHVHAGELHGRGRANSAGRSHSRRRRAMGPARPRRQCLAVEPRLERGLRSVHRLRRGHSVDGPGVEGRLLPRLLLVFACLLARRRPPDVSRRRPGLSLRSLAVTSKPRTREEKRRLSLRWGAFAHVGCVQAEQTSRRESAVRHLLREPRFPEVKMRDTFDSLRKASSPIEVGQPTQ